MGIKKEFEVGQQVKHAKAKDKAVYTVDSISEDGKKIYLSGGAGPGILGRKPDELVFADQEEVESEESEESSDPASKENLMGPGAGGNTDSPEDQAARKKEADENAKKAVQQAPKNQGKRY